MEDIKKFYETLKSNKTLAEEFKKQLDAAKPESEDRAAELVVKFAAAKGYSFTAEELKSLETETKALDKKELDKINAAGGLGNGLHCSILFIDFK